MKECFQSFRVVLQAEDRIRFLVRSRRLRDVYEGQVVQGRRGKANEGAEKVFFFLFCLKGRPPSCLLYTLDAADFPLRVDPGGPRIITKNNNHVQVHML